MMKDSGTVIRARDLTKRYGEKILATDNLNLEVRRGEVYGFLGPNGAGKTTTLRMLLGLVKPTSGMAWVLGEKPGSPRALARLGSLVESPAFYPYLSGRDNLRVLARYAGVAPSRVDRALGQVRLSERADDRYRTYSLGMKQRLGVARALLKDPELLILDEPTNGLDPEGMAEMRDLVREQGREERTVFLSSHLMSEVEQVCDRVGIIHKGSLVAEEKVSYLKGQQGLVVRAEPLDGAIRAVEELVGEGMVAAVGDGAMRITVDPARAAEINRHLMSAGFAISELCRAERSLEDVFLRLTREAEA
jgi:ABC-2 type transport system ATP-binding protein